MQKKTNNLFVDEVIQESSRINGTKLSAEVQSAMRLVDRKFFIEKDIEPYVHESIDIGCDQTCSDPTVVAHMADKLHLAPELKALEIGTGCGYSTAVHLLLMPGGTLFTLETIPELVELAKDNIINWYQFLRADSIGNREDFTISGEPVNYGYDLTFIINNQPTFLRIRNQNGYYGYPEEKPFDRIILTAGIKDDFSDSSLLRQLKCDNSTLIYPERSGPMHIETVDRNLVKRNEYGYFIFVPLVKP